MSTSESEQLREYQFIKRIGKGSFGEVYLVRKRRDRKQVSGLSVLIFSETISLTFLCNVVCDEKH